MKEAIPIAQIGVAKKNHFSKNRLDYKYRSSTFPNFSAVTIFEKSSSQKLVEIGVTDLFLFLESQVKTQKFFCVTHYPVRKWENVGQKISR